MFMAVKDFFVRLRLAVKGFFVRLRSAAGSEARKADINFRDELKQFKIKMYLFLPELVLAFISLIYFPKNYSLLSIPVYIAVFAVTLAAMIVLKGIVLIYALDFTRDDLTLAFVAFFNAMIEIGIFFQLYIRTLTPNERIKLIELVILGVTTMVLLIVFRAARVWRKIRKLKLIKKLIKNAHNNPDGFWLAVSGLLFVGICVAIVVGKLGSLRLQIAMLEGSRLLLVLLVSALAVLEDRVTKPFPKVILSLSFAAAGAVACMFIAVTGEMGTILIVYLFTAFGLLQRGQYRLLAIQLFVLAAVVAFVAVFYGPGDHYYQRIFGLTSLPQVNQVRDELVNRTYLFPNPTRYAVRVDGALATRCEDFSFLNFLTVFGKIIGVVVLFAYAILLEKAAVRSDRMISSRLDPEQVFARRFSQYASLMLLSSCVIHAASNTTALFFTGVNMPFVSDGLTTMVINVIFLLVISCTLSRRKETSYENVRKDTRVSVR